MHLNNSQIFLIYEKSHLLSYLYNLQFVISKQSL